MRFAHLAQRMFNTPLALHPAKAEVIMASLAERLGLTQVVNVNSDTLASAMESPYAAPGRNPRAGYEVVEGVAIIPIQGTLVQKLGTLHPYSGMTGYDGIRQNFLMALADDAVSAIMLDIDSPGGEVSGCFDLVDTIYAARGAKPIHAILNESAYSAAYAIASAADRITVPRTGGTGSIGVIWMHVDWSQALADGGFRVTFITHGESKADGHPEIPLSKEARQRFQDDIDAMGELFDKTVARNRGLTEKAVRETQAKTYLGAEGVRLGLADTVAAPDAAFRALLQELAA
ncbi:S49 family peptidase [Chromobacterium haemolyticum]|uniref:S49 family peptidase n=1 Tax=Chromobacterium TaxID=535 RepID=UPI0040575DF4